MTPSLSLPSRSYFSSLVMHQATLSDASGVERSANPAALSCQSNSLAPDGKNRAWGVRYHLVGGSPSEMRGCPEMPGSIAHSQDNQIGFKFCGGVENPLRGVSESHGSLRAAPQLCLLGDQLVELMHRISH